jgi:hypothetical protein
VTALQMNLINVLMFVKFTINLKILTVVQIQLQELHQSLHSLTQTVMESKTDLINVSPTEKHTTTIWTGTDVLIFQVQQVLESVQILTLMVSMTMKIYVQQSVKLKINSMMQTDAQM